MAIDHWTSVTTQRGERLSIRYMFPVTFLFFIIFVFIIIFVLSHESRQTKWLRYFVKYTKMALQAYLWRADSEVIASLCRDYTLASPTPEKRHWEFPNLEIPEAPLHPQDRHYTAFLTEWGLYQYKVSAQGHLVSGDEYN